MLDPIRPGAEPFKELDIALVAAFQRLDKVRSDQELLDLLRFPAGDAQDQPLRLGELAEELRILTGHRDATVLITIDQFEELLAGPPEAPRFLAWLREALGPVPGQPQRMEGRLLVVATLRSEFLGTFKSHHALRGLPLDQVLLGPMGVEGLTQMIEGPAQVADLVLEQGLSQRMVNDTHSGDALPLLAFSLRELWDRQGETSGSFTLAEYKQLGGLEGAVGRRAEEVIAAGLPCPERNGPRPLSEEELTALRDAFLAMTRLNEEGQLARVAARWEAMPPLSRAMLERFVEARLLVSGNREGSIEVAHEALLRNWPRLVRWLEESQEFLLEQKWVRRLVEEMDTLPSREGRIKAIGALEVMAKEGLLAVRQAIDPLAVLLGDQDRDLEERQAAVSALAVIGGQRAATALLDLARQEGAPVELRRAAAEALGAMGGEGAMATAMDPERWDCLEALLRCDGDLPLRQGASRGLQLLAARNLPLFSGPDPSAGRLVPMLTLTTQQGRVSTEVVQVPVWQLPLPDGERLELVVIPGGTTTIGAERGEMRKEWYQQLYASLPGCAGREHRVEEQRRVVLNGFALARYPITNGQWRAVAALPRINDDLNPEPGGNEADASLPVVNVSWNHAQEWCRRLNQHLRQTFAAQAPRVGLPSEAQWEVACRACSRTAFHFGDTINAAWANFDGTYAFPPQEPPSGVNLARPTPVGPMGW